VTAAATTLPAAALPPGLVPYARTREFTEAAAPPALLSARPGAWALIHVHWGLIHVHEGRLACRVVDPRRAPAERILAPGEDPGVLEPAVLHEVEPLGPVRFHVEYHRAPGH
jgi:hypothetical protein